MAVKVIYGWIHNGLDFVCVQMVDSSKCEVLQLEVKEAYWAILKANGQAPDFWYVL